MKSNELLPVALSEASPALREALEKKVRIQTKILELQRERDGLQSAINDAARLDRSARVMDEADLILAGGVDPHKDFTPRMDTLYEQIQTLRKALVLHEREIEQIRSSEAFRLGEQYRGAYAARASRIAGILEQLGPALQAEYDFRQALLAADYPHHTFGPLYAIPWLGHPGEATSGINRLLGIARENGYLP